MKFLGSHDHDNASKEVKSRYGKWKNEDKNIINSLNIIGKDGLELLGYEPQIRTIYIDKKDGFDCRKSTYKCPIIRTPGDVDFLPESSYNYNNKCSIQLKTDYKSNDLQAIKVLNLDANACCRECYNNPACHKFTLDVRSGICYLKGVTQAKSISSEFTSHLVSGSVISHQ